MTDYQRGFRLLRLAILGAMLALSAWFFAGYGSKATTLYGDDMGYYVYLPSAFIFHNLDSIDHPPADSTYPYSVRWYYGTIATPGQTTPTGHVLIQYTYGVALTELPFFLAAHAWTTATGGNVNGYSPPYIAAIRVSSLVYAVLGLLLTWRVLRRHFGKTVSLWALCCIYLGTNLFWFTLHQAGMAHVPLFFLYALLMWLSVRLHERPRWGGFFAVALVAGLITLIRPTDIICLSIPLLYGVTGKSSARERLRFLKAHWPKIAVSALVFLLPIIPQMLYWKWLAGTYLYYSYGDQGFFWLEPKIWEGLTSAKNGWLAYNPVMIFSLAGLLLARYYRAWSRVVWLLLPLYIYIVYSWYCWNYINGLGSRPMVHLYALLALPLAAAFGWLLKLRRRWIAVLTGVCALLLIGVNLSFSLLQSRHLIMSEESVGAYNLHMLFRTRATYDDLVYKDIRRRQPDTAQVRYAASLAGLGFNEASGPHIQTIAAPDSGRAYRLLDSNYLDSPLRVILDSPLRSGEWLRCSGRFMYPDYPGYWRPKMVFRIRREGKEVFERFCEITNKTAMPWPAEDTGENRIRLDRYAFGVWGEVYFFLPADELRAGDVLELQVDNGRQLLWVDWLKMEIWRE